LLIKMYTNNCQRLSDNRNASLFRKGTADVSPGTA
jgi:hypothetical protein